MTQAAKLPAAVQPDAAWQVDQDAFQQLAEPYRRQLHVHCYRMLGSLVEAEDMVQETYLRAWRARERFEGRTSFGNWLYRIATNASLNALAARPRASRILPQTYGPATDRLPEGKPATEVAWLQPYPDSMLDDIADTTPGPDARYEMQESVQLAFVAAIQQLPPRQRAVLLLRDVLGWSAAETAQLLDASVASVNSVLQRARSTLSTRLSAGEGTEHSHSLSTDQRQRELLDRYLRAWEASDIDSFVDLLREDAVFSMPPWPNWYRGRAAIRTFFEWGWRGPRERRWRALPIGANRQPAFVQYLRDAGSAAYRLHGIQVLTLQGDGIASITVFLDPAVLSAFGVPASVSG